jgi:hypothetical protein
MSVRTRSQADAPTLVGWYERPIGGPPQFLGSTRVMFSQTTVDETVVGDNFQFNTDIFDMSKTGGRMNGGDSSRWYHNFVCDYFRGTSFGHPVLAADKGNGIYAASAAARTTPSRPYVDVPVNVLQLGEITQLIKKRGESFIAEIGRDNLRNQFAIAPLVSDLVKLFYFQDQVERRIKELERLRGSRGLRRTIPLGRLDSINLVTDIAPFTASSSGSTTVILSGKRVTSRDVGAHVRWKPSISLAHLSPGDMRVMARRAVLGSTLDLSTIWQIVPWSWLIDWASNFGDYLKANRNIVPATLSSITITRHTRTVYSYGGATTALFGGVVTTSPMVIKVETKNRTPTSIVPAAHFPFLSGNQMGILASLYVTRR